jgi:hypothetical protein
MIRLSDMAEGEAVATGAVLASPHHSAVSRCFWNKTG